MAITLAIVALSLFVCGDCSTHDQTWFVQYLVLNRSSEDVFVRYGTYFLYSYKPIVHAPVGTKKELAYYEEFLGPPPDANRSFTCVSVYRESDSLLVFQLAPVSNSQWKHRELMEYHEEYMLELTDAKLHEDGIKNRCGELTGSVVDSVTAAPLDCYHVAVWEDAPESYDVMQNNTGPTTTYSLIWYGDVPDGAIRFTRRGYQCRMYRVPADADSLGDRRYELNAALAPLSLPEDSLRYGACP